MVQLMYLCPCVLTTSRSVRNSLPGHFSSFCYLRNIGNAIYFLCICGLKTPFTECWRPFHLTWSEEIHAHKPASISLSHTHTHTQNPLPLSTTSTISCCLKAIAQRWLSISVWNIRVPCHSCFSPQSLNIQTVWEGKHPVLRELTIL